MPVFHAILTKIVVAFYEEYFVAYAFYNFDVETMVTAFRVQTPMFFTAMNCFC